MFVLVRQSYNVQPGKMDINFQSKLRNKYISIPFYGKIVLHVGGHPLHASELSERHTLLIIKYLKVSGLKENIVTCKVPMCVRICTVDFVFFPLLTDEIINNFDHN